MIIARNKIDMQNIDEDVSFDESGDTDIKVSSLISKDLPNP